MAGHSAHAARIIAVPITHLTLIPFPCPSKFEVAKGRYETEISEIEIEALKTFILAKQGSCLQTKPHGTVSSYMNAV